MEREAWDRVFQIANPWERRWFSDEEAESASGLAINRLRLIQRKGLIKADIVKRSQGPSKRAWSLHGMLIACLVSEMAQHSGVSISTIVGLLKLIPTDVLDELMIEADFLISEAIKNPSDQADLYAWPTDSSGDAKHSIGDVSVAVFDRQYVFLEGRYGELGEEVMSGLPPKLIGIVSDFYGREPNMKLVNKKTSARDKHNAEMNRKHPVSVHRINLELSLKRRVATAFSN